MIDTGVLELLEERGKTHGPYVLHASIAQTLKDVFAAYSGKLTPCMAESLDMIAHKIGRILAGDPNVKDHWDDIAGYARLVSRELEKPKMGFTKTQAWDCGP